MGRVDLEVVRCVRGKGRGGGNRYDSRRTATLAEVQPVCEALRAWSWRRLLCFSKARKAASSARTEDRRPRNASTVVENLMIILRSTSMFDIGMGAEDKPNFIENRAITSFRPFHSSPSSLPISVSLRSSSSAALCPGVRDALSISHRCI